MTLTIRDGIRAPFGALLLQCALQSTQHPVGMALQQVASKKDTHTLRKQGWQLQALAFLIFGRFPEFLVFS